MLKTRLLSNIFLTAILIALSLLAYLYVFILPAYRELLTENAEDEAVRFASFLIASHKLTEPLSRDRIPPEIAADVGRLHGDEMLIKLRIFSAEGEIIYSTLNKEVGTINKNSYFHEQVAAGEIYSKVVKKNALTAEMEIVSTDLVETYVPIMLGDHFNGAIETYYDITTSTREIESLTRHSLFLLTCVSFALLSFLYYALHHADHAILARHRAEADLRQTNEDLESRVTKRAGELVEVNRNLTREIAERTLAQMALSEALAEMREDKEKITGILRSVDDGLLVTDSQNQIVLMNKPAEDILEVSQDAATGVNLLEVTKGKPLSAVSATLLSGSISDHLDFEMTDEKSGKLRTYQARTSQLRDDEQKVQGTVILIQDVTRKRELEQMKADFLAMAAHELSTPLATILGYAELLSGEHAQALSAEVQRESLTYIHDKATALSRIVDDLLDVSRIESGQQLSIVKQPLNLHKTLTSAVKNYSEMHTGHTIQLDRCELDGTIQADPIRIGQVLENIMSNAIKYTPVGGTIRVSCWAEEGFQLVEISDNGIGMTSEQLDHIFDKFFRADASDTAKPGIGLGMSITRHIIEVHGGKISVESEPGTGTTVTFSLPESST